jgi:hypothetical protein
MYIITRDGKKFKAYTRMSDTVQFLKNRFWGEADVRVHSLKLTDGRYSVESVLSAETFIEESKQIQIEKKKKKETYVFFTKNSRDISYWLINAKTADDAVRLFLDKYPEVEVLPLRKDGNLIEYRELTGIINFYVEELY